MPHIPWRTGKWTHQPSAIAESEGDLLVTAKSGSDAWRETSYGFIHDSEHALLAPFLDDTAVEVEFTADYAEQFDQAGLFVKVRGDQWVKAGVEFADGRLQLGAVVTDRYSDWSLAPVPNWAGQRVRIRVSRSGNALTIRAAMDGGDLQLVRVVPFSPVFVASAGPFLCAPSREGLTVAFHSWTSTPPDHELH